MIFRKKNNYAFRSIREVEHENAFLETKVDVTHFLNYYGTLNKSQKFNDPVLYTEESLISRIKKEIKEIFMEIKKHARN